ncbi:MAG TPA: histidinol-phosphate transaminase [Cyclobacteriaceae bacterium]
MESPTMNRRHWMKTSATLAGAMSLLPSIQSFSTPIRAVQMKAQSRFTEEHIAREFPKLSARLFANENPFGPSDKAKQAIMSAIDKSYQYPIGNIQQLAELIATHEGLTVENIALAPGSTTLLGASAVYFSSLGAVISGDPSYEDLPGRVENLNAKWIKVPLTSDYKLDLDAMEKMITHKTSLVYICNPNNPTGTVLDTAKLRSFCERVSKKVPVFIDEAYIDYLGDPKDFSMIDLVKAGHNVMIARTFSKLYGFAGLRAGYVVAQPKMIKTLNLYTWAEAGLNATTVAAAMVAYRDTEFLKTAFDKTMASKDFLYDVLKKEGYEYIPSSTNFVMFPVHVEAERFVEEMMKRGVGVRPWKFNKKEWCRVSIGTMEEMQFFAEAFKQVS